MRWENYVFREGIDFQQFWTAHLAEKERSVLVVLGLGFDPRMCVAAKALLECGGDGPRNALTLAFNNPQPATDDDSDRVEANKASLAKLFEDKGEVLSVDIQMREAGSGSLASINTQKALQNLPCDLNDYTDIILDISATPRMIALTSLAMLLWQTDRNNASSGGTQNLHVVVAENHELNGSIQQEHLDEETVHVQGFSGELSSTSTAAVPRVWFPILGENRREHMEKLNTSIAPDEICPVLPWPAESPSRADRLVEEYRDLLFDTFQVDPRNFLYASALNPFGAYRAIYEAISHYHMALEAIGGCKVFVSPLSSKLLSIGATLACYELKETEHKKVGIHYLEPRTYGLNASLDVTEKTKLSTIWIAGECYE